jgi:hypothetical protein
MNAKMKVLSLALIGLCGYAGSALAACPAGPAITDGGAWSGKTQTNGTVAIATPGFDSTECKMTATLAAGASAFGAATVRDDTPNNEPRYRVQLSVNADAITSLGAFEATQLFAATSAAAHVGTPIMLRLAVSGGANKVLTIAAANEGASGNVSTTTVPLVAGNNRIEVDLTVSASGSAKVWLNNGTEGSPNATLSNLNNAGWVGVDRATMGVSGANNLYRANHATQLMSFDQFDSRRSTFIGTP